MQNYPGTQKKRRRSSALILLITLLSLILISLVAAIPLLHRWQQEQRRLNIRQEVTMEAGSPLPGAEDFRIQPDDGPLELTMLDAVYPNVPGEYAVTVLYYDKVYSAVIRVVDTTAPTADPVNQTTVNGETREPSHFTENIQDATDVRVTYLTEPDFNRDGNQTVTLVLTDTSGNSSTLDAELTVILDTTPPEIQGVQDFVIYQGDAVSYRSGVTATDDRTKAPTLTVDSSTVDLSKPGEYQVVYTAADEVGNSASVTAKITVLEKRKGYASLEEIYAMGDEIIAKIIKPGMTDREKVETIFKWAKRTFVYWGHSEKLDWHQGAYVMIKKGRGDCFNYFSVTKLLFERLGIPNIDVKKVKNYEGDSNHFWSMVSVDGGETYYHFDCCPRAGDGDWFLLVTDAELDAYSNAHNRSHNRDKSLYPATPDE